MYIANFTPTDPLHIASTPLSPPLLQGGINDKFALGGRRAMSHYLNRVALVDLNFTSLPRDGKSSPTKWVAHDGGHLSPRMFVDHSANCTKKAGCSAQTPRLDPKLAASVYDRTSTPSFLHLSPRIPARVS